MIRSLPEQSYDDVLRELQGDINRSLNQLHEEDIADRRLRAVLVAINGQLSRAISLQEEACTPLAMWINGFAFGAALTTFYWLLAIRRSQSNGAGRV